MMFALLSLIACTGSPPEPVVEPTGTPLALLHLPVTELEFPDDSRGGAAPAESVALKGPWTAAPSSGAGHHPFTMSAPFRSRAMFFMRPQAGMRLEFESGRSLPYRRNGRAKSSYWNFTLDTLTVVQPTDAPPEGLWFTYPRSAERELALNFSMARDAGLVTSKQDFAIGAQIQEGYTSRTGLLLPAPGIAAWKVTLPQAPVLTLTPGLVRPELGDLPTGDGCRLIVEIEDEQGVHSVFDAQLERGVFTPTDIDLARWAEKPVTVRMKTDPNTNPISDYCFIGDPRIHPKRHNPRRVVLVFVDTLRPDHLSLHGYSRNTSPKLDAFAKGAVVFENTRSVAPWTLPSARAVLTGRQPEFYGKVPTLQQTLTKAGFATGMIAGNVYLSTNFEMGLDWGEHEVGIFPPANEVTDQALDWLGAHESEDSLLLVHYMSAHLPYREPVAHRHLFAGDGPQGLQGEFHVKQVRRAPLDKDGKQYVVDRYDNCVHWIDEELERLYSEIDDNDILVFFSDHGEEFWDHAGYEHGHSLYDELLRVPLVIKAAGLTPGRVSEPTSLLDIMPTVLELVGVTAPPTDGQSLVAAANGDPDARRALADRLQAFGRPLYGLERWGVMEHDQKWTTYQGAERLYDLADDPDEHRDLSKDLTLLPPMRQKMGEALGSESGVGFRIVPTKRTAQIATLTATVHLPGGIRAAWRGQDPRNTSDLEVTYVDADTVTFTWKRGSGQREAFVLPKAPVADALKAMTVTLSQHGEIKEITIPADRHPGLGRSRGPLVTQIIGRGSVQIGWSLSPTPPHGGRELSATSDEQSDWMIALGYEHDDAKEEDLPELEKREVEQVELLKKERERVEVLRTELKGVNPKMEGEKRALLEKGLQAIELLKKELETIDLKKKELLKKAL